MLKNRHERKREEQRTSRRYSFNSLADILTGRLSP
jgi:hypothetical protein